jgi:hypothetical protein
LIHGHDDHVFFSFVGEDSMEFEQVFINLQILATEPRKQCCEIREMSLDRIRINPNQGGSWCAGIQVYKFGFQGLFDIGACEERVDKRGYNVTELALTRIFGEGGVQSIVLPLWNVAVVTRRNLGRVPYSFAPFKVPGLGFDLIA